MYNYIQLYRCNFVYISSNSDRKLQENWQPWRESVLLFDALNNETAQENIYSPHYIRLFQVTEKAFSPNSAVRRTSIRAEGYSR